MRGYEAVWTDLSTLWCDVECCETADDCAAVSLPIVDRLKSHHGVAVEETLLKMQVVFTYLPAYEFQTLNRV